MATKILIVDDSSSVRQHVGILLTQAGYEVVQAVDGLDGINQVKTNDDLKMIVCDVHMPNMDGLEMLRNVKADESSRALPVLMLTSEVSPSVVQEARAGGACGWIVKPFKPDMLLACVRKLAPL